MHGHQLPGEVDNGLYVAELDFLPPGVAVIAGIVFEDTIRRICRVLGVTENGIALDTLISELAKKGTLTALKAKHARFAAGLRTSAAQSIWSNGAACVARRGLSGSPYARSPRPSAGLPRLRARSASGTDRHVVVAGSATRLAITTYPGPCTLAYQTKKPPLSPKSYTTSSRATVTRSRCASRP
jgi:hypothetical protein